MQPITKLRDITTKESWGSPASLLPNDNGWRIGNKQKALDTSYGVKGEVKPKSVGKIDGKLFDADSSESFGA